MSHPSQLNSVIARAVDGSKFDLEWYHKNYLDHVYAVSDDSGDLNEHYRYTAFGEVTIYNNSGTVQSSTQINNTITWNTRRLDAVSNYYLYKYRHYDPQLGRWPSRDPIGETGGVNLYAFVGNHPTYYWDYLGLNKSKPWKPIYDSPKEAVAAGSAYASYNEIKSYERKKKKYDAYVAELKKKKRAPSGEKGAPLKPKRLEFCGPVCCEHKNGKPTGKYYFAQAHHNNSSSGCKADSGHQCKKGDKKVGAYHNHPITSSGNENFSRPDRSGKASDTNYADKKGYPFGLGYEKDGKTHVKVYDPTSKEVEVWKQNKAGKWIGPKTK